MPRPKSIEYGKCLETGETTKSLEYGKKRQNLLWFKSTILTNSLSPDPTKEFLAGNHSFRPYLMPLRSDSSYVAGFGGIAKEISRVWTSSHMKDSGHIGSTKSTSCRWKLPNVPPHHLSPLGVSFWVKKSWEKVLRKFLKKVQKSAQTLSLFTVLSF